MIGLGIKGHNVRVVNISDASNVNHLSKNDAWKSGVLRAGTRKQKSGFNGAISCKIRLQWFITCNAMR
jgi:hypothetical protein